MSAMDMFWAAPPVARTITAITVALSVPVHMELISAYYVAWITQYVFTWRMLPQIWRFVTPFFITGPKFGLLMDPYFLWTYASQLELEATRFSQPGDFFTYITFVCSVIMLVLGVGMDGAFFLSALTLALAYTYAQENPNRQLSYFIVTFSAKYLPYSMLAMTFVMASPQAALHQATGLIAAHLYEFLTKIWPEHGGGRKLINTPAFVARWFATAAGTPSQRSFGTAYSGNTTAQNVGQQRQAGGGGGWASGFSQGSWNSRGQGRRLGGD